MVKIAKSCGWSLQSIKPTLLNMTNTRNEGPIESKTFLAFYIVKCQHLTCKPIKREIRKTFKKKITDLGPHCLQNGWLRL